MATYKPLQSVSVTAATSSITFSGIDQNYTDLVVVSSIKATAGNPVVQLVINSDTNSNYSRTGMYGDGATPSGYKNTSASSLELFSADTTNFTPITLHLANYSNITTNKAVLQRSGKTYPTIAAGLWRSTSAINALTMRLSASTFEPGSTFSLYGIKAGSLKAIGGDLVTSDGNYWYHVFRSTATFVPTQTLSVEVLVVAGGGSQGAFYGAAGGAGGLRGLTGQSMTSGTTYTVTVGGGGASTGASTSSRGNNGTNSSISGTGFSTITASGGGGGAGAYTGLPFAGGSGGGGNTYSGIMAGGAGNVGGYTPVEGYAGEQGSSSAPNYGGAGGGAGQAGGTNGSGIGGDGSSAYSAWGLATGTGENVSGTVYYAGGGSGNIPPKAGGKGGGGDNTARNGFSAWVGHTNTGGGSGSAADNNGYAGGSGIVIVRYPV
jgi:hypothetical protein